MKAAQMIDAPFFAEARAIMDLNDLPPESFLQVRASLVHNAFKEEIAPYIQHLASIHCLALPGWTLHKDGHITKNGDGLTEPMREIVGQLQARIDEIKARYDRMF